MYSKIGTTRTLVVHVIMIDGRTRKQNRQLGFEGQSSRVIERRNNVHVLIFAGKMQVLDYILAMTKSSTTDKVGCMQMCMTITRTVYTLNVWLVKQDPDCWCLKWSSIWFLCKQSGNC